MSKSVLLLSLLAGLLFSLAFAPIAITGLAFISLAILYTLLDKQSSKNAFSVGLLYGISKYSVGISWLYVCIANFSNAPTIIAFLITCFFILFLAMYEAVFAFCYVFLFKQSSRTVKIMGFSLLFILFEWLRATLLTGFPWLLLGQALIDTPLASLAPIVGEFGLGFLGFLLSALLATGCMLNKKRYFILFVLPFMLVSPLSAITWTHSYATPLKVSLVQGNVSQNQKWVSIHLDDIIDRYVMLTEENWSSDLIIWPETAIPMPSLYLNSLLSELEEKASQHHTHLLVGIPYSKEGITLTNAMMMLGDHRARYEKRHLVPFGEYVPFTFLRRLMTYFDIPLGSLKAGSIKQAPLLFNNVRLAPFICYDIVFSQLLLPYLPSSNLIVTLSDDSWYGHSFAKAQHLQIARLRSLESGRAQIFSTNNGLTALINEKGVITKQLREEKVGVLTGHIELKTGNTPWGHLGDIPFIILFLIMLLCLIFYQRIYRK